MSPAELIAAVLGPTGLAGILAIIYKAREDKKRETDPITDKEAAQAAATAEAQRVGVPVVEDWTGVLQAVQIQHEKTLAAVKAEHEKERDAWHAELSRTLRYAREAIDYATALREQILAGGADPLPWPDLVRKFYTEGEQK